MEYLKNTYPNILILDENLNEGDYEYYVRTYYESGCVSDSSNHVKVKIEDVGIENEKINKDIIIYPNPTTGEIIIENGELNTIHVKIEHIYVYDMSGRLLDCFATARNDAHSVIARTKSKAIQNNGDAIIVNISHLPKGIYYLQFQTNKNTVTKKIVKL
jgi:hypothetical protein